MDRTHCSQSNLLTGIQQYKYYNNNLQNMNNIQIAVGKNNMVDNK